MIKKITFKNHDFYIFENDSGVSTTIKEYGAFGTGEISIYNEILGENDVFVDVGMNIGAISFQIKLDHPEVEIIGFEPVPEFFALGRTVIYKTSPRAGSTTWALVIKTTSFAFLKWICKSGVITAAMF